MADTPEDALAHCVANGRYEDLPADVVALQKTVLLTNLGCALGGANEAGCAAAVDVVRHWGGRPEASLWVHGGKVPAHQAAFANSIMARALDLDDIMQPGIHVGAAAVPVALALAERMGEADACSGKALLAALALGTEVAARINAASEYDGFDPVGVCAVFACAAIAARLMGLNATQTRDALGIAFNRAGGSFQNNVDGALAVRFVQGFAAENGIVAAELARRGVNGPRHFLTGVHGYFHLYAKDKANTDLVAGALGTRFEQRRTAFKRYPSSGSTLGSTQAALEIVARHAVDLDDITAVRVKVSRGTFKNAGQAFELGAHAAVNAQFSIRYCVANALLRKAARIAHFEPEAVADPRIAALVALIDVQADAATEQRGRLAADVEVETRSGERLRGAVDIPAGMPGNPLAAEEHLARFHECVAHARPSWPEARIARLVGAVEEIEACGDVRHLLPLITRPPVQVVMPCDA